ncbi:MAG TPA: glycosyltransferase family 39 protein [Humisphaera sp.]|jgi:hypothetical protein|nr:glycosyltransferase family 39 protein [Humisphaera sp.]
MPKRRHSKPGEFLLHNPTPAGRFLESFGNLLVLVIFVALVLVGTIIYTFPSGALVTYRCFTDGAILLLWLCSAAGYGKPLAGFALRDTADIPPILQKVTSIALGLGALSLFTLGLGLAGFLNTVVAWILIGAGVALLAIRILRNLAERRARLKAFFFAPAYAHWMWLLAAPATVIVLVGSMIYPGILWHDEPNGYDVVEYHLQIPREWFELGRIVPLHHNVFSFFPFNVEMHYLLAMHLRGGPWAGMYLSQLMHATFIALTIFAIYGFVRWDANRTRAVIASVALACVPWLAQLAPIAYDEGGLLLFGALAIGWAMAAVFREQYRARRFALAGIFAGFACGSKLTGVPEVLVAVAAISAGFAVWYSMRRTAPRDFARWRGVAIFALAGGLTFSPWLIRNIVWVHNPVFPEATQILGHGTFSEVQIERWHRAHTAQPDKQSVSARLKESWHQIIADWRFGYLFLPLALVAIALSYRRAQTWFLAGLLVMIAVVWLFFTHLQGRFLILALPIGALLIGQIEWDRWPIPWSVAGLLLIIAVVISQAAAGAVRLHIMLADRLYGERGIAGALGIEIQIYSPEILDSIPKDANIILVGDAKAFLYQTPMSRLKYRTVFDVDTSNNRDVVDAWAGSKLEREGAWLVIDPGEFARFEKTYQPMTPLPASVLAHDQVYVVRPGEQ